MRTSEESGAALGIVQVVLGPELGDEEFGQGGRCAHQLLENLLAVLADVAVRIVFLGQEQEADRLAVGRERQADFERAPGRLASRLVAVESEHQLLGQAQQL